MLRRPMQSIAATDASPGENGAGEPTNRRSVAMLRKIVLASALAVSMPVLAATATITGTSGRVLVDTGNGQFMTAQQGQVLSTGDRIMVSGAGSSSLTFDDGCVLNVQPDTLITIPSTSTCAGGLVNAQVVTPNMGMGATTVDGRVYEDSWWGWAAIAGIVLITAWKIAEADDEEDEDDTVSP
jgi:hypothetical protein